MRHGPCGVDYPDSPCMVDGKCSKGYPKAHREKTSLKKGDYPLYRRPADGPRMIVKRGNKEISFGSESVVPYNAWTLLKFNAHINFESCANLLSVKYIHK
jgi:hypothetical protein